MAVNPEAFGERQYRTGALERLAEAGVLLAEGYSGGAIYLAGRAAEGALRAVLWKRDIEIRMKRKSLDTGHDLRELLARIAQLGLITGPDDEFRIKVAYLARLWQNNMRFASGKYIGTRWFKLGAVRRDHSFKRAAESFYNGCSEVIKRCELLCENKN